MSINVKKGAMKTYYRLKPFIPRSAQIFIRRIYIKPIKARSSSVWPIDEQASIEPESWQGWPYGKSFAVVLTHDVETGEGQDSCTRLARLEAQRGFRSSFNFVPERYNVRHPVLEEIEGMGFEIGVHGLNHDGKLYDSRNTFTERAQRINSYIHEWHALGFRSPSMHHQLDWMHELDILYDASTFDTDPFEPQSAAVGTIFPFWIRNGSKYRGYAELPYTLAQDWTLFILMRQKSTEIWRKKIDWIAERGGMVLLNTHPDYMNFENDKKQSSHYPVSFYEELLDYIKDKYSGEYWQALPCEVARFTRRILLESTQRKLEPSYVLITAARNEESYIERTILAVLGQTVKPLKWIIVSDGSTDRTDEIIESYMRQCPFIELLKEPGDNRRNFGSKAKAVQAGCEKIAGLEYDYIGNLDADIAFEPEFYSQIMDTFEKNPELGVSGGMRFDRYHDGFRKVHCSRNSVGGPFQMFRRECFEQIGGYRPLAYGGIDAVAEISARMNGWKVESFPHIRAFHYRPTGTAGSGELKAKFRAGIRDYLIGYHPLFEMLRTMAAMLHRPFLAGGLCWMSGYTWAAVKREQRPMPDDFIRFLRNEQLQRMSPKKGLSHLFHKDNPDGQPI